MGQLAFIKTWLKQNEIPFATNGKAIFFDDFTLYELDYEFILIDIDNNIMSYDLEEILAIIAEKELVA